MATNQTDALERRLKIVGVVVTVVGLLVGVVQFGHTQAVEASKPYLEKKLKWCEEATETASVIATHDKGSEPRKEQRFGELYWGVMGLVENQEITNAMISFGDGLKGKLAENKSLKDLSLAIAHACRKELSKDWSPIWSR